MILADEAAIIYLTTATSSGIYIIIILLQQYLSICCRIKLQRYAIKQDNEIMPA